MSVIRVNKTRDYTVMSNYHLRDENLSLKAVGLMSWMLSLPDNWNFTTEGIVKCRKEGRDAIRGALKELEDAGYLVIKHGKDKGGKFTTSYTLYEQPKTTNTKGKARKPQRKNRNGKTESENSTQINTNKPSTNNTSTKNQVRRMLKMEAWKMEKKARESVAQKMAIYHGESKGDNKPLFLFDTYEEAKEAGSVSGMLQHKMSAYRDRSRGVVSLSKEYSDTLSIIEIQSRLKEAKALEAKAKSLVERLYDKELERVTREYQKTIGGLQNEDIARGKALEYMGSWVEENEVYKEALKSYTEAKKEATALNNARDMYIEDNKELIRAEQERAKREELLSSGILEDFGITPVEE